MKKNILKILILLAIVELVSCTDTIKIDLPEGETLLVVDAFLTDQQSIQTIKLTTTSPYFSNVNCTAVVGANVLLTDLINGKTYTFSDLGTGNYSFSPTVIDSFGIINHTFRLDVNWAGMSYFANSKLNRTSPIDTIVFIADKDPITGVPKPDPDYRPYIFANDQDNGKDYYWIKTYKNGVYFNDPANINVVEDAGGTGTDGLSFIPPNAYLNVTPRDESFKIINGIPDNCTTEIYAINADTYLFLLQAQSQMTNSSSGLFAVTPENVKTNIMPLGNSTKAIGWFNIGAIKSKNALVQ